MRQPSTAEPGYQTQVDFELPDAETRIELRLNPSGWVHFVGYAAPGSR